MHGPAYPASSPLERRPFRSFCAKEVLQRLQAQVDAQHGFITHLTRVNIHPSLYVFLAEGNPARVGTGLPADVRGLRSYCGGKGTTEEMARMSGLCEGVERLSGRFYGTEECMLAPYESLSDAIDPNALQQFSALQFDYRADLNRHYRGFCEIPPRFDSSSPVLWSPAKSLSSDRTYYVPTAWAYYGVPQERGRDYFRASSNGCAAGSTSDEALLHGLLELIERDSVATWWYSRALRPEIRLDPSWLAARQVVDALIELGREVWLLNVTGDLGIPVAVAVSRRVGPGPQEIVMGFGAHFDMRLAAERALCEVAQLLPEATIAPARADGFHHFNPSITYWWRTARIELMPFLMPHSHSAMAPTFNWPDPGSTTLGEALSSLNRALNAAGLEAFVIDQTRPNMDLAVVRAIVPGLRSIQPAFAPGRLFRTPVQLGWLPRERAEHELNPMPLPA